MVVRSENDIKSSSIVMAGLPEASKKTLHESCSRYAIASFNLVIIKNYLHFLLSSSVNPIDPCSN